jgi:hypothetical protein
MLAAGTAFTGLLTAWVWWPIVAAGLILAGWQGRRALEKWRIPAGFDGRALIWVALALAAGIWLAGATRPEGLLWSADAYDSLEYHLQVPREFYHAGSIGQLRHNCYSYYPLGTEMLFLLAMCLRKGAYEGMYLAKMLHGAFGVLAVAAVFGTLKADDESRGRFAAGLLGTIPLVIYLGWLAMVELAMVCQVALAVLWLRQWLGGGRPREAACIGLLLGAACATKYLSVGLIAAPVLFAMIVISFASRDRLRRLAHAPLVAAVAAILFAPWLIRNAVYTGNPVFPLGTSLFGRGHWSGESQQRWQAGHGPQLKPPVPIPPTWRRSPVTGRVELLHDNLMTAQELSPMLLLLAGVAICVLIAAGRKAPAWDWALALILAAQIAIWMAFSHQMPSRFLAPATVPMALLAGGMLAQLAKVRVNPLRRIAQPVGNAPWGRPAAVALLATTMGVNLIVSYLMYREEARPYDGPRPLHGQPARLLSMDDHLYRNPSTQVPPGSRFLLVGDSRAWYWPEDTIYATAFDSHPLAELADAHAPAGKMLEVLRALGITHIVVNWYECWRLAGSYGYPAALSADLFGCWQARRGPGLKVLEDLQAAGMRKLADEEEFPARLRRDPARGEVTWPVLTIYAMPWAPIATQPASGPASRTSQPAAPSGPGR